MKKRTMKKYIPKNTCYCYEYLGMKKGTWIIFTKPCKWHSTKFSKEYNEKLEYCLYINRFLDIQDWCKDCEVE